MYKPTVLYSFHLGSSSKHTALNCYTGSNQSEESQVDLSYEMETIE